LGILCTEEAGVDRVGERNFIMFKILIVDDEALICEFIQGIIDWAKLEMVYAGCATDGLEAFELIKSKQPDLVITDIRMPGLTGLSLIEKVKKEKIDCAFIVISGYQDFEYVKSAFNLGVENYILKPIDEKELEKTLIRTRQSINTKKTQVINQKQADQLRENYQQTSEFVRKKIICDILLKKDTETGLLDLNQRFGCTFAEDTLNVVLIAIDVSNGLGLHDSQYKAMNTWLEESIGQEIKPLCHECQTLKLEGRTALLLNYAHEQWAQIKKGLEHIIERIKKEQFSFFLNLTVGVGSGEGKNISALYEEASHALDCRITIGSNRIIYDGDCRFRKYDIYQIITVEWENRFCNAVDTGNLSGIRDYFYEAMEKLFAEEGVDPEEYFRLYRVIVDIFRQESRRIFYDVFEEKKLVQLAEKGLLESYTPELLKTNLFKLVSDMLKDCSMGQGTREKWPVLKAKKYVEEHYAKKVSVKEVADLLYLNPDYFSSFFKKEVGIGFSEYVMQYRMAVARQLIRKGEYSITQIAEMVGYPEPKHFSKVFRKTVGVSPAGYKRLHS